MSFKQWVVKNADKDKIKLLAYKCDIPALSAAVLCARELDTQEKIKEFFNCENIFVDPYDFNDMDKFVERVNQAINSKEKICVYGDYDADGVTASSVMVSYLQSRGANVMCYIPERNRDGYGLNNDVINKFKAQNVNLIITVDNGISAFNEIQYANSLGIDVVVTDHHQSPEVMPPAVAIVDPHRNDSNLEYKNYAGVGVTYKAVQALEMANNESHHDFSDLVAIGTIGDSIELLAETRGIVKKGLASINKSSHAGINALLSSTNLLDKDVDSLGVAFGLVPKINASGRMEHAAIAFDLLMCKSEDEADKLCNEIMKFNNMRRELESKIFEEAELYIKKNINTKYQKVIVVAGENWHHGVLGIIAARIAEKYGKPCIVITMESDDARGSCRSIGDFSIYNLLSKCSDVLERFGGHTMAAGINLKTCNVQKFIDRLCEESEKVHIPSLKLNVDLCLNPSKISEDILPALDLLKPFGNGNPEPIFGIMNVELCKIVPIGAGKHLKLGFKYANHNFEALCFNKKYEDFIYKIGSKLDIAVAMQKNIFRGNVSLAMRVLDIKPANCDFNDFIKCKNIYEKFRRGRILNEYETELLLPSRSEFAMVYKYLKSIKNKITRVDLVCKNVFKNTCNIGKIYIIIDVLGELNLAEIIADADEFSVNINYSAQKVNLDESRTLNMLKTMREMGSDGSKEKIL